MILRCQDIRVTKLCNCHSRYVRHQHFMMNVLYSVEMDTRYKGRPINELFSGILHNIITFKQVCLEIQVNGAEVFFHS